MSDRMVECRKCHHEFHEFAIDASGRCGGCVLAIRRRWAARAVMRKAVFASDPWPGIRARRDIMLGATDWTQLPDVPERTRLLWQPYRQALRDITNHSDPAAIAWPEAPNGDSHD